MHDHKHTRQASGLIDSFVLNNNYNKSRKLVVIQLSGGNDGLNTIIPYRNDIYHNSRPTLALSKNQNLALDNDTLIHSSMDGFKDLYDKGLLNIINNVGYPNPTRSHFSAMDIWHTASLKPSNMPTGWIGRLLDQYQSKEAELKALELSDSLSLALRGMKREGIAVNDFIDFFDNLDAPILKRNFLDKGVVSTGNQGLDYIYEVLKNSYYAFQPIVRKSRETQIEDIFDKNEFSRDCYSVCNMIISGSQTQIYYISLGGFDTHANQKKVHQQLLSQLSKNVHKMVNLLKKNDCFSEVSFLVFSEFGRRVKENASLGTDHGAANNVFLISDHLQSPGLFNELPDLTNLDDGDITFTVDFRSVYASLLRDWLGVRPEYVIDSNLPILNIFSSDQIV